MNRLTVNKPVQEMNMIELAHNSCFANDRKAMYRDYDTIIDAREFVRNLIKCRGLINIEDEIFHNDDAFDEFMAKCLVIDPRNEIGLIALFYCGLWAQADLYEKLKRYEDLEERGLLPKPKCKPGDIVWEANKGRNIVSEYEVASIRCGINKTFHYMWALRSGIYSNLNGFCDEDIGKTVFLTQAEADEVLNKMKGGIA